MLLQSFFFFFIELLDYIDSNNQCWHNSLFSVCSFTSIHPPPPPPLSLSQSKVDQEDIYEALQKMDKSHNGQVNFKEFSQSVAILAQGFVKYGKGKGKVHQWNPSYTFLNTSFHLYKMKRKLFDWCTIIEVWASSLGFVFHTYVIHSVWIYLLYIFIILLCATCTANNKIFIYAHI